MLHVQKKDTAISPIIAIILMIVITLILASLISVFSLGLIKNIQSPHNVAITVAQKNVSTVELTNRGGKDLEGLLIIYINGTDSNGNSFTTGEIIGITTGSTKTIYGVTSGKDHLLAIGYWKNGNSQIILNTYV